jgi:hypothetical protein
MRLESWKNLKWFLLRAATIIPPKRRTQVTANRLNREERRLSEQVAADPLHLHRYEKSIYSQNGEDGILAEIFRRIGDGTRWFVEIGAADGTENCTAALVDRGWQGVWIEADAEKAARARVQIGTRPVDVTDAFVDRDSIGAILDAAGVPLTPDLLVIDIDGNDYWIWKQIACRVQARVVLIEYNAVVGPRSHWVLPYDPRHTWDESYRHGASLAALARLGTRLGYTLVGCDSSGVNAFFVSASQASKFTHRSLKDHHVGPRFRLPYGHPAQRMEQLRGPPLSVPDATLIDLRLGHLGPTSARPGGFMYVEAEVRNGSTVPIGHPASYPTLLACWWLDENGVRSSQEPLRSVQDWRANPGGRAHLVGRAIAPMTPGRWILVFGLVQESIRWLPVEKVAGAVAVGHADRPEFP